MVSSPFVPNTAAALSRAVLLQPRTRHSHMTTQLVRDHEQGTLTSHPPQQLEPRTLHPAPSTPNATPGVLSPPTDLSSTAEGVLDPGPDPDPCPDPDPDPDSDPDPFVGGITDLSSTTPLLTTPSHPEHVVPSPRHTPHASTSAHRKEHIERIKRK